MAAHRVPQWAAASYMERQRSQAGSQASIGVVSAGSPAHMKGSQVDVDERDKNRAELQNQVQKTAALQTDVTSIHEQIRKEVADMHERLVADQHGLQQEQQSISELKQEISEELAGMKEVRKGMEILQGETTRLGESVRADVAAVKELRQQADTLRTELQRDTAQIKETWQAVSTLKKELSEVKEAAKAVKSLQPELQRIKEDLGKMKQEVQESKSLKPEIAKLKEGLSSNDELVRLKSRSELTTLELKELQKKLYDCGVLAPAREEPLAEDSPPVGSIELGEDIFSARLLLRLGFMKASVGKSSGDDAGTELDSPREFRRGYGEADSDEGSDGKASFDEVTGIVEPEVEEGGWAYCEVTCGWVLICVSTICLQLLILVIMMRSYIEQSGQCFSGSALSWWLLHLSRCTATIVAGALMTKELMDTVNYWMISELLEPSMSWEVVLTAVARVLMQFLIIAASVFLFLSSNDPAETWMNMTALGFIATLGQDILEVAKRGVFGHHIQGAITNLNYQLTLEHDYPSWFPTVRNLTLLMSIVGIVGFAVFIFVRPDPVCGEHAHHHVNATISAHHAGAGGFVTADGGGGGGHHHR